MGWGWVGMGWGVSGCGRVSLKAFSPLLLTSGWVWGGVGWVWSGVCQGVVG